MAEDPEEEADPNDAFTWAQNEGGLQSKVKFVLEQSRT